MLSWMHDVFETYSNRLLGTLFYSVYHVLGICNRSVDDPPMFHTLYFFSLYTKFNPFMFSSHQQIDYSTALDLLIHLRLCTTYSSPSLHPVIDSIYCTWLSSAIRVHNCTRFSISSTILLSVTQLYFCTLCSTSSPLSPHKALPERSYLGKHRRIKYLPFILTHDEFNANHNAFSSKRSTLAQGTHVAVPSPDEPFH